MTYVFVTTDDVCPENIRALWHHWDSLKKYHPLLKVTCFVSGKFHNTLENDVYASKDFKDWYKERKDWVEVAAHGLHHKLPPEFTKFTHHQEKITKAMTTKLRKYLPANPGFKAPFLRMNHKTIDIIQNAGYAYVATWNCIHFLVPMANPQLRLPFLIVQSHTNAVDKQGNDKNEFANKDNINLIKLQLHRQFLRYEKKHVTYGTISEYIERFKA